MVTFVCSMSGSNDYDIDGGPSDDSGEVVQVAGPRAQQARRAGSPLRSVRSLVDETSAPLSPDSCSCTHSVPRRLPPAWRLLLLHPLASHHTPLMSGPEGPGRWERGQALSCPGPSSLVCTLAVFAFFHLRTSPFLQVKALPASVAEPALPPFL